MIPHVVKCCEKMRSMQPGVLEGVICSGTLLASNLLWLLRAVGLQADERCFSSMCKDAIREVKRAQPYEE